MDWLNINSIGEWDSVFALSAERDVVLFKHSVRCHISAVAKRNFENDFKEGTTAALYCLIDVIHHRDVSDRIAADLYVKHESPQLILVRQQKAVYHCSHNTIDFDSLMTYIASS